MLDYSPRSCTQSPVNLLLSHMCHTQKWSNEFSKTVGISKSPVPSSQQFYFVTFIFLHWFFVAVGTSLHGMCSIRFNLALGFHHFHFWKCTRVDWDENGGGDDNGISSSRGHILMGKKTYNIISSNGFSATVWFSMFSFRWTIWRDGLLFLYRSFSTRWQAIDVNQGGSLLPKLLDM